jgi:hypothetical protein
MPVINQITLILETTYKYRNPKSVEKENSREAALGIIPPASRLKNPPTANTPTLLSQGLKSLYSN